MRVTPHAEIQQFARDEYRRTFSAAPPKVRNAVASVALGEPRPLRYRGHGYTVPPLSYSHGARLMAVLEVLNGPTAEYHARALKIARSVLHACVRTRRNKKPWTNPFDKIDAANARSLIESLLHVPDESPIPATPAAAATIDLLDGLTEFVRMYPAWVGTDGLPVSWEVYQIGMRRIAKMLARDTLRLAQANRISQSIDQKAWKEFAREQRITAGWN